MPSIVHRLEGVAAPVHPTPGFLSCILVSAGVLMAAVLTDAVFIVIMAVSLSARLRMLLIIGPTFAVRTPPLRIVCAGHCVASIVHRLIDDGV